MGPVGDLVDEGDLAVAESVVGVVEVCAGYGVDVDVVDVHVDAVDVGTGAYIGVGDYNDDVILRLLEKVIRQLLEVVRVHLM